MIKSRVVNYVTDYFSNLFLKMHKSQKLMLRYASFLTIPSTQTVKNWIYLKTFSEKLMLD